MTSDRAGGPVDPPPFERLRERLLSLAGRLEVTEPDLAAELRAELEAWWPEQRAWIERVRGVLAVHHEINNALVGVRGNAQLVVLGPAGQMPGVRDRMEVVIRESDRIQQLAAQVRQLKAALGDPGASSRAA